MSSATSIAVWRPEMPRMNRCSPCKSPGRHADRTFASVITHSAPPQTHTRRERLIAVCEAPPRWWWAARLVSEELVGGGGHVRVEAERPRQHELHVGVERAQAVARAAPGVDVLVDIADEDKRRPARARLRVME